MSFISPARKIRSINEKKVAKGNKVKTQEWLGHSSRLFYFSSCSNMVDFRPRLTKLLGNYLVQMINPDDNVIFTSLRPKRHFHHRPNSRYHIYADMSTSVIVHKRYITCFMKLLYIKRFWDPTNTQKLVKKKKKDLFSWALNSQRHVSESVSRNLTTSSPATARTDS